MGLEGVTNQARSSRLDRQDGVYVREASERTYNNQGILYACWLTVAGKANREGTRSSDVRRGFTVAVFRHTVDGKKDSPPGGFLAITRYHSIGEAPGSVEIVPSSLPELPKPSRTLGKSQKPIF